MDKTIRAWRGRDRLATDANDSLPWAGAAQAELSCRSPSMQRPSTALERSTDTQAALGTDAFEELRGELVRRVLRNQFEATLRRPSREFRQPSPCSRSLAENGGVRLAYRSGHLHPAGHRPQLAFVLLEAALLSDDYLVPGEDDTPGAVRSGDFCARHLPAPVGGIAALWGH